MFILHILHNTKLSLNFKQCTLNKANLEAITLSEYRRDFGSPPPPPPGTHSYHFELSSFPLHTVLLTLTL